MVSPIFGRSVERTTLRELLDSARSGQGGAIVLRGDAGVGKSVLLQDVTLAADDFDVLRVAGVESEMNLGFAALHRLVTPLIDGMQRLPDPQRRALEATFGLSDRRPDRFLVSLAVLTLLTNRALAQPVLCVVDDAQWIDRESLEVIGFTARRLQADRVAVLLAMRDTVGENPDAPEALPSLHIDGLRAADARELLATLAIGPLSERAASRIVAETGGIPLALIELASELSLSQLSGRDALPDILPVGERLHEHFRAQMRKLPSSAQMLLVLAAAEPSGDAAIVMSAARALGLSNAAYDAAGQYDLVSFVPSVEFRHPLVRSVVYSSADASDRRRAHTALAEATRAEWNSHRRAWHLAAAATFPDEAVAAELWRCADGAYARGGYAAEAAFRLRAAELTPDPALRGRRLLAAASAHLSGGAPHAVRELLERASALLDAPVDRAQTLRLGAMAQLGLEPAAVAAALLRAARLVEPIDATAALQIYGEAVDAVMTSIQFTVGTTPREVAQAALNCVRSVHGDDTAIDPLIAGFATRLAVSYEEAFPLLRDALEALHLKTRPLEGIKQFLGFIARELWEEERAYELLSRSLREDRDAGRLETLRIGLVHLGHHEIWRGRFGAANECCAEVVELSRVMGPNADAWQLSFVELSAWLGDEAATQEMCEVLLSPLMETVGSAAIVECGLMALDILNLGLGRYREAFAPAWRLFEEDAPARGNQVLPEIVEAGTRCGELEAAALACERLSERATTAATPWALGLLARSKALLAADCDAEDLYREALALLGKTSAVPDLARAELLFGEWLRRHDRKDEARERLLAACAIFESIGARLFEERARRELFAAGARARKSYVDPANELTPQEAQVTRLAAVGATNPEIAAQLFISSSTVDYHLRKVFRKLGISSRRALVDTAFGGT
jgi:DNA-binding CsgD family transcriptional regulator